MKTKNEQEIYEFYRCWKYTKYYKTWKLKSKDRPKHNMASLSDIIYHERQIWAVSWDCSASHLFASLSMYATPHYDGPVRDFERHTPLKLDSLFACRRDKFGEALVL